MSETKGKNRITVKKALRAIWRLCSYLFVPQWGKRPADDGQKGYQEEQLAKQQSESQES